MNDFIGYMSLVNFMVLLAVLALSALTYFNLIRTAKKGATIMATVMDMKAAVEQDTSVTNSAVILIQSLAAKIQELINQGADPAALQALVDELNANNATLAAAVAANTPVDPTAPPAP